MPAITAQPVTVQPVTAQPTPSTLPTLSTPPAPELPEGPVASDARLRDATLQWPDSVANPRRTRVR